MFTAFANKYLRYILLNLLLVFIIFSSLHVYGENTISENDTFKVEGEIKHFIDIENQYKFYGLASYYNTINYFIVKNNSLDRVHDDTQVKLNKGEWLAVVGRLKVMLVKEKGLNIKLADSNINLKQNIINSIKPEILIVNKSELSSLAPELSQLRYNHLWGPLAFISELIESILVFIYINIYSHWGWSIVLFAIVLKILLLPVGMMTIRFQRKVSKIQKLINPTLAEIKASYDGEEAHNLLMKAHHDLGVSPFYTLKPMLGSFIQIPILVAVFNVLGEMSQLDGEPFLWINNLAYPDSIGLLPYSIPLLGNNISLLPFIMTIITLYSTYIFQNKHAPASEVNRQKLNLYFMALVFFILFYAFPASMVLYWTLANILQTIQQQLVKL